MKMYCYKIKYPLLKIKENNYYARAKIEKYGFMPMFEEFEAGKPAAWVGGWAKSVKIGHETKIGTWIKKNIESIYKSEKDKKDSKWLKEILDTGYEFDEEGHLIENDMVKQPTDAQLCVMKEGFNHGILFINVGGAIEFYDTETLRECCSADIAELEEKGIIYEKRFCE